MRFFAGAPPAEAALIAGAILLFTRSIKPERIYAELDGELLVLFAGLFIVVAGAEKALLTPERIALVQGIGLDVPWRLSVVTAVLSNIVSNVPAVLILRPFVPGLHDPARAWLVIAMASTLAGNLTLLGSVANLIVAKGARRRGRPDHLLGLFQGRPAADAADPRRRNGVADMDVRLSPSRPRLHDPKSSRNRSIWCIRWCRIVTMPMSPFDSLRQ